jgi:hypothetical protein
VASSALYWAVDFFVGAPPGNSSKNNRCSLFNVCARARDNSPGSITQQPQNRQLGVGPQLPQPLVPQRDHHDGVRVGGVGSDRCAHLARRT